MPPLFASFRVFRAQTSDLLRIIHGNESRFQSRLIRVIRVSKISVALKIFGNFVPNFRERVANGKHYPKGKPKTKRKTSMKKQQNNSTRGWALPVALSIALLSISAVLLASSFSATPATSGLSATTKPVAAGDKELVIAGPASSQGTPPTQIFRFSEDSENFASQIPENISRTNKPKSVAGD